MPIDGDWAITVRTTGGTLVVDCAEAFPPGAAFLLYSSPAGYGASWMTRGNITSWPEVPAVFPAVYNPVLASGPTDFFGLVVDAGGSLCGNPSRVTMLSLPSGAEKPFRCVLSRQIYADEDMPGDVTGYRIVIRAVETRGIPRCPFLFRKSRDGLRRMGDEFLCVCRPGDFDLPEDEPDPDCGKYRKDVVDVITHSVEERDQFWFGVAEGVEKLVETMHANVKIGSVDYFTAE